jgi:hypothetical protein
MQKSLRIALILTAVWIGVMSASYLVVPPSPIFPSTGIPALVQAVEAHTTGTPTSLSVSFGSLPALANVVIVAAFGNSIGASNVLVSDNQNNAYSKLIAPASTDQLVALWCTPVTASSGTYTATVTDSLNSLIGIFALEYSATSCNMEKSGRAFTSTSPYNCGSFTTINAHDLLLVLLGTTGSTGTITYTAPSGFTIEKSQGVAATGQTAAIADKIVSATATFTPTFSASQNIASTPCLSVALLSK